MNLVRLIALGALVPAAALAQEPEQAPAADVAPAIAEQAVEQTAEAAAEAAPLMLETLVIGRGSGGRMLERSAAAGGYTIHTFTSQRANMGLFESGMRMNKNFRFFGAGETAIMEGDCTVRTQGRSLFGVEWDVENAQSYTCAGDDVDAAVFGMEVLLPVFRGGGGFSIGGLSMSSSGGEATAEQQAVLRARMVYQGATYEAAPTGFTRASRPFGERVVDGYTISRDSVTIGGVDFEPNDVREGTISAPVAGHPDREAVIFMALHLLSMPDIYSSHVRDQLSGN